MESPPHPAVSAAPPPPLRMVPLRRLVLAALALIIAAWSLAQFSAVRVLVERSYLQFEHQDGVTDARRLDGFLAGEIERLLQVARDWGDWDDTAEFVRGLRPDYVEHHLDPGTFDNLALDFLVLTDTDGRVVHRWRRGENAAATTASGAGDLLTEILGTQRIRVLLDEGTALRGVTRTARGLMATAAVPVLESGRAQSPVGVLVLGRDIDAGLLAAAHKYNAVVAELFLPGHPSWPPDVAAVWQQAPTIGRLSAAPIDEEKLGAYVLLSDVDGVAAGILRSVTPRHTKRRFELMASYLLGISLLLAGLLTLAVIWVLERRVLSPIAGISRVVSRVARDADLELRVPDAGGRDELGQLGREVNAMLCQIAAQQQLREARDVALAASAQKSAFLANMSHEIRTPMNGILGMLELVLETELTEQQQERVRTAYRSAEGLLDLLNDILDFSKLEAGKFTLESREFDLRELVENVVTLFAPNCEQKGLALSCYIAPGLPRYTGDPMRLQQVMTNLLGNAAKFTTEGEVAVEVTAGEAPGHVRIVVADTGIGIPAERVSLLFRPFSQVDSSMARRFGGTGLGLAICRQLVEGMGGGIEVSSVPANGTRFVVTLRLRVAAAAEEFAQGHFKGRRALVCGPDDGTRRALVAYLGALGLDVVHAASPALALRDFDLLVYDDAQADAVATALRRQAGASRSVRLRLTSFNHSMRDRVLADTREQTLSRPVQFLKLQQALTNAFRPVALPASIPHSVPAASRLHALEGKRVLLVEDNCVNQALALGMLETYDVVVECAANGIEALQRLGAASFDLVLMDCQMPELDGLEATRRWRARERQRGAQRVPIIALTANAMAGDREACLAAGMNAYLAKPFTRAALTEVLRTWLTGPVQTVDDARAVPLAEPG